MITNNGRCSAQPSANVPNGNQFLQHYCHKSNPDGKVTINPVPNALLRTDVHGRAEVGNVRYRPTSTTNKCLRSTATVSSTSHLFRWDKEYCSGHGPRWEISSPEWWTLRGDLLPPWERHFSRAWNERIHELSDRVIIFLRRHYGSCRRC